MDLEGWSHAGHAPLRRNDRCGPRHAWTEEEEEEEEEEEGKEGESRSSCCLRAAAAVSCRRDRHTWSARSPATCRIDASSASMIPLPVSGDHSMEVGNLSMEIRDLSEEVGNLSMEIRDLSMQIRNHVHYPRGGPVRGSV